MEQEIYNAFIKAGVSDSEAKAAVESLIRVIDRRYSFHAQLLDTKGGLSETKMEIIKWTIFSRR